MFAAFNDVVRQSPGDAMAHDSAAISTRRHFMSGEAIADYSVTIRIDPGNAGAIIKRGDVYLQILASSGKGKTEALGKAIADFTAAIRLQPENFEPYWRRGGAYASTGDYDKVIADETAAIRLNPGFASAYSVRATAYETKGDKTKAAADLAMAEKLRREHSARGL